MSRALVFVGGFGAPGNEWPLTPIRRSAREQGWRTKYFNERLVFWPIATSAERLVNLIKELDQDPETIVVVGHSTGASSLSAQQQCGADRCTGDHWHTAPRPLAFTLRSSADHEGDGDDKGDGMTTGQWRSSRLASSVLSRRS